MLAAVHAIPGLSHRILLLLLQNHFFDRPVAEWTTAQLISLGMTPEQANKVVVGLPSLNPEACAQQLQRFQAQIMTINDPSYPAQLKEIPSPPPILYVRGTIDVLTRPALAVVGTRQPTVYGRQVTQQLVAPVARAGISIVSGLALGIDATAHRTCLANTGTTIAVLGTGIDLIYPWEHGQLANEIIAAGGAFISEFPLGARPERHHFPQRNRIISGLSRAVLLIEAGEKSGALITAKFAVDQNRDVLVVPGPITSPLSIGVNNWLKLGAKPITTANDILETFSYLPLATPPTVKKIIATNPIEEVLLSFLSAQPVHIDVLVEKSRLDTSVVSTALSLMEIQGQVEDAGGSQYILSSSAPSETTLHRPG